MRLLILRMGDFEQWQRNTVALPRDAHIWRIEIWGTRVCGFLEGGRPVRWPRVLEMGLCSEVGHIACDQGYNFSLGSSLG
jgi:hypothetical protein